MDIKDLNKSQLILLTLLISFITSIATGIVTVSFLDQAPPAVTQTINRVVQKTIETVVPAAQKNVQTVIIKEEDLIVDAIDKNKNNIVKIEKDADLSKGTEGTVLGYGLLISPDGHIIADSRTASDKIDYFIFGQGVLLKTVVVSVDRRGFSILKAALPEGPNMKVKAFTFSTLADSDAVKLGQSAVVLAGTPASIYKGIIAGFGEEELAENTAPEALAADTMAAAASSSPVIAAVTEPVKTFLQTIRVSFSIPRSYSGSPLINLDGAVVGLAVSHDDRTYAIPSNIIKAALDAVKK